MVLAQTLPRAWDQSPLPGSGPATKRMAAVAQPQKPHPASLPWRAGHGSQAVVGGAPRGEGPPAPAPGSLQSHRWSAGVQPEFSPLQQPRRRLSPTTLWQGLSPVPFPKPLNYLLTRAVPDGYLVQWDPLLVCREPGWALSQPWPSGCFLGTPGLRLHSVVLGTRLLPGWPCSVWPVRPRP